MKNRPDKPGLYWWEDDCGRYHVAEFDEEMETLDSCDTWGRKWLTNQR
jgi:hypothetical protein